MRGGNIAEVERRVLAHENDIDIPAEIENFRLAKAVMAAGHALDGDRVAHRPKPPFGVTEVLGRVMIEDMPELLRLQHDGKGGIALDVDSLGRVHLNGYA